MNYLAIQKKIEKLVAEANFSLRSDLSRLLRRAYLSEKDRRAKKVLGWILKNAEVARTEHLAICQDTGLPVVFIEAGRDVKVSASLIAAIKAGIESGYRKNRLRQSVVSPIIRGRPGYRGMIYHLDFSSARKGLRVTLFPKGFGSENKSRLKMFNPTASLDEIESFIVESVKKAGPEACPPFVIGIGIGGTSDRALLLAKEALLGRVDRPNQRAFLNKLEKKLFKKINSLGIGPMGLGGKHTCLAVKIKKTSTHIAGLPVGINISCHALRSASIRL